MMGRDPSSAPRRPRYANRGEWRCSTCEEWNDPDTDQCACGEVETRARVEPLEA